jgi:hypothetical protein
VASIGCVRQPQACARVDSCGTGYECLAGRCVPFGGEPVPPDTERLVRFPCEVRVSPWRSGEAAPAVVTFGDAQKRQTLLLRFEAIPRGFELDSAFLLLEPVTATAPATHDLTIVATRATSSHGSPSSNGIARAGSANPLRIDVTALVRSQAGSAADLTFRIEAEDTAPHGASYALGSSGKLPLLEVYGYARPRHSNPRAIPASSPSSP